MYYEKDVKEVLLSQEEIRLKVNELGERLTREYEDKELVMVGILRGAVVFFADLIRAVKLPMKIDFISVSSYGASTKSSGVVRFQKDLDTPIEGKHVIIVEDIVDTGLTLAYLVDSLKSRNALSVKTCCLLDKPSRRKADIVPDYTCFQIPDKFVVGYGLDFAQSFRNLPYIGVLKEEAYSK